MNRRNWLKKSAGGTMTLAFSSYIPHVLYNERYKIPGEDSYLRLHWNENPYGASPMALDAVRKILPTANHYPDDKIEELTSALSENFGLSDDEVMITAGSTEILSLLGQKVGLENKDVLMSQQSFPTLAIFAERCNAKIKTIPTSSDERIDLDGILDGIDGRTGLIFICNPNNPTSTDLKKEDLVSFINSVPDNITICVDEAYIQYSRSGEKGSLVALLADHKNLLICRTFSKAYGLAGMRIGFALGSKELINQLKMHHLGFGMANSRIAVTAALASLQDDAHLDMVVQKNEKGRQIVYDAFNRWDVHYATSATNFIYARSDRFVSEVRERLQKDKILITKWPSMTEHIRISIGKPEWMEKFVFVLKKYVI